MVSMWTTSTGKLAPGFNQGQWQDIIEFLPEDLFPSKPSVTDEDAVEKVFLHCLEAMMEELDVPAIDKSLPGCLSYEDRFVCGDSMRLCAAVFAVLNDCTEKITHGIDAETGDVSAEAADRCILRTGGVTYNGGVPYNQRLPSKEPKSRFDQRPADHSSSTLAGTGGLHVVYTVSKQAVLPKKAAQKVPTCTIAEL
eukprot:SAG22_NODE_7725_length_713_cov_10.216612_1_plen_196_part_00